MPQRLPPVLSAHDLPVAELFAARLDGELFRIDDCFAPIDEIVQPEHRALALRSGLPERLIAEQRSAAWIWGATDAPPVHHQLCVAPGARISAPPVGWMRVREVVITASELTTIGGMQVTNPLRTVIDLARFSESFGEAEARIVTVLARLADLGLGECLDDMNGRRNLPNKRQAIERLRGCLGR
jgi:hypothetical protein